MKRLAATASVLALLAVPVAASAQDSGGSEQAQSSAPRSGAMIIRFANGLPYDGRNWALRGMRMRVQGRAKPFVAGQKVKVTVTRSGKEVAETTTLLRRSAEGVGQFTVSFHATQAGVYLVRAVHEGTAEQETMRAKVKATHVLNHTSAGSGSSGLKVHLLQRGLKALGYSVPKTGRYDAGTKRAVLAFRKVNGMGRKRVANRSVFGLVFRGRGTFELKYPDAGKHVEFDWSRQVLVLASGGKAERIYHSSSGKPSTPTVMGRFRFYRKSPGTNSHGMVHSSYFIRGYAIHGYKSVPTYPASHGCLRVPIPNALSIYRWIDIGDPIYVYR